MCRLRPDARPAFAYILTATDDFLIDCIVPAPATQPPGTPCPRADSRYICFGFAIIIACGIAQASRIRDLDLAVRLFLVDDDNGLGTSPKPQSPRPSDERSIVDTYADPRGFSSI